MRFVWLSSYVYQKDIHIHYIGIIMREKIIKPVTLVLFTFLCNSPIKYLRVTVQSTLLYRSTSLKTANQLPKQ